MKEREPLTLLGAINTLLWAVVAGFFIAIAAINAMSSDTELAPWVSPTLSYGLLYSIGAAALMQTFRRRKENSSDAAFGLKLMAMTIYLLSVTAALLKLLTTGA